MGSNEKSRDREAKRKRLPKVFKHGTINKAEKSTKQPKQKVQQKKLKVEEHLCLKDETQLSEFQRRLKSIGEYKSQVTYLDSNKSHLTDILSLEMVGRSLDDLTTSSFGSVTGILAAIAEEFERTCLEDLHQWKSLLDKRGDRGEGSVDPLLWKRIYCCFGLKYDFRRLYDPEKVTEYGVKRPAGRDCNHTKRSTQSIFLHSKGPSIACAFMLKLLDAKTKSCSYKVREKYLGKGFIQLANQLPVHLREIFTKKLHLPLEFKDFYSGAFIAFEDHPDETICEVVDIPNETTSRSDQSSDYRASTLLLNVQLTNKKRQLAQVQQKKIDLEKDLETTKSEEIALLAEIKELDREENAEKLFVHTFDKFTRTVMDGATEEIHRLKSLADKNDGSSSVEDMELLFNTFIQTIGIEGKEVEIADSD